MEASNETASVCSDVDEIHFSKGNQVLSASTDGNLEERYKDEVTRAIVDAKAIRLYSFDEFFDKVRILMEFPFILSRYAYELLDPRRSKMRKQDIKVALHLASLSNRVIEKNQNEMISKRSDIWMKYYVLFVKKYSELRNSYGRFEIENGLDAAIKEFIDLCDSESLNQLALSLIKFKGPFNSSNEYFAFSSYNNEQVLRALINLQLICKYMKMEKVSLREDIQVSPSTPISYLNGIGKQRLKDIGQTDNGPTITFADVYNNKGIYNKAYKSIRDAVDELFRKEIHSDDSHYLEFRKHFNVTKNESSDSLKVATWNIRAWSKEFHSIDKFMDEKIKNCDMLFTMHALDVLVIIECPNDTSVPEFKKRMLNKFNQNGRKMIWLPTSEKEAVAFIVNESSIQVDSDLIYLDPFSDSKTKESDVIDSSASATEIETKDIDGPHYRLVCGIRIKLINDDTKMNILGIHAPSNSSNKSKIITEQYIEHTLTCIGKLEHNSLLLGDFNFDPKDFKKSSPWMNNCVILIQDCAGESFSNIPEIQKQKLDIENKGRLYDNAFYCTKNTLLEAVSISKLLPHAAIIDIPGISSESIDVIKKLGVFSVQKQVQSKLENMNELNEFINGFLSSQHFQRAVQNYFYSRHSDHRPLLVTFSKETHSSI